MATRIVPLVLDDRIFPDNENAFLLDTVGTEAVTVYSASQHYRRSRMKAVFVLQCSAIPNDESSVYTFTVRSPFPSDIGDPNNAPNLIMQPLGASDLGATGTATINDSSTWPLTGDITPAPSFILYAGTIPAWVFVVNITPTAGEGTSDFAARITVDFSHSIT